MISSFVAGHFTGRFTAESSAKQDKSVEQAILNLNKDQAVIMSKQMVTKNGSYISSEGIYIITDEDIENYFNSSLVFYIKKDDESVF